MWAPLLPEFVTQEFTDALWAAQLEAHRTSRRQERVRIDDVVELAKLKAAGELTQEECDELVDLLAVEMDD